MKHHMKFNIVILLILLIFLPCAVFPASYKKDGTFKFIVLGDNQPQDSSDDSATQPPTFINIIKEINLLKPDFVVNCGDFIFGSINDRTIIQNMWNGFKKAIRLLDVPHYLVVGNHDVWNELSEEIYLENFGQKFKLYYDFEHKGCLFIVLNTEELKNKCRVCGKQLKWLRKILGKKGEKAKRIYVFLHRPLWAESDDYDVSDWEQNVHPILAKHGVDIVFSGHQHLYRKSKTKDGVRYIITGGAGGELKGKPFTGGFHHYLLVTVEDNNTHIAVIKPGSIVSEDIVTYKLVEKIRKLKSSAKLPKLKIEKGQRKIKEEVKFVFENHFNDTITGEIKWVIPDRSAWEIDPICNVYDISPNGKTERSFKISYDENPWDKAVLKSLPTCFLNCNLGDTELFRFSDKLQLDYWPYTENISRVVKNIQITEIKSSEIAKAVATEQIFNKTVIISFQNTLACQIAGEIKWKCNLDSSWRLKPLKNDFKLLSGQKVKLPFQARFSSTDINKIFPLPQFSLVADCNGTKILNVTRKLNVETVPLLQDQPPKRTVVRETKIPPVIDGILNDKCWVDCASFDHFMLYDGSDLAEEQTIAYITYDSRFLYIAFKCYESMMPGVVSRMEEWDDKLWTEDSIEIFLNPNPDKIYYYYHLIVNCIGTQSDEAHIFHEGRFLGKSWDGKWIAKASKEPNFWIVEIAIPAEELGKRLIKGDIWRINLNRNRIQEPREWSCWSCTLGGYHKPERFGEIEFN